MKNLRHERKGVLLDLDGTIVDSREAHLEAIRAAFKAVGLETSMVDMKTTIEIPKRLEQGLPIDGLIKGVDVRPFLKAYLDAYYKATATKARPLPNISETLKKLSDKAKLGLITMRYVPGETIITELEKMGLAEYFQIVVTALDTQRPKPSPEALIACAKRMGIDTCACLVVGDSVADIRAGKAAGAKTVAVLSGIFSREELESEKPDLILKNVNSLPDFLDSLLEQTLSCY